MTDQVDPRFHRSSEAILAAARDLLLGGGPSAVTHAQVAERAGVGRATVYRHWPRIDQLLAEAMSQVPMPFFSGPVAPSRGWLRSELASMARQLELDDVRAVTTTLANSALWDRGIDERRETFATVLADRLAVVLSALADAGELTPRSAPSTAAASLIGPIYYRSTIEHGVIDDDLIDAAIDALGEWRSPHRS